MATARRCFMADHGAILSHHRPTGRWFVEASDGLDESAIEEIKGLSMTVIRRTSDAMESLLIPDATRHDLTRNSRSVHAYNIQAVICAPILNSRGETWGVIYLDNSGIPNAFDDKSRTQLNQFASFRRSSDRRSRVFLFPSLSSLNPPYESKYTKCPKGSYIPTA